MFFADSNSDDNINQNDCINKCDNNSQCNCTNNHSATTAVSFASTVTDADDGIISISLTSTQTANLKPGRYVYDVKITRDGTEFKAVEGVALVRGGVTR